eukprot:CAMPEP_0181318444 /NCGR_PEP_ID=MMETSP1101-20121128/17007_1 /TAXON_ID=46948 /ORGANISM="Rhodomonas abbreviata, Strain Caron Lab Isolate" /LENGTH=327 /DNA_ID=CAMNT_0023425909 /DNA_START=75 /DNA_END=1058 /DNA_ORIENTATION=+
MRQELGFIACGVACQVVLVAILTGVSFCFGEGKLIAGSTILTTVFFFGSVLYCPQGWLMLVIASGSLLTGLSVGSNLPMVVQIQRRAKLATVNEFHGGPESLEFVNGVTAFVPSSTTKDTIKLLGAHEDEKCTSFDNLNRRSRSCWDRCSLVAGLIDAAPRQEAPAKGFSMTIGCSVSGKCSDMHTVRACIQKMNSSSTCVNKGAIPVGQVPQGWRRSFPQEAVDDFMRKNNISSSGFSRVQFFDFDSIVRDSWHRMLGCGIGGFCLTAVMAGLIGFCHRTGRLPCKNGCCQSETGCGDAGERSGSSNEGTLSLDREAARQEWILPV